jgi:sugar lactone lactonase YvrE
MNCVCLVVSGASLISILALGCDKAEKPSSASTSAATTTAIGTSAVTATEPKATLSPSTSAAPDRGAPGKPAVTWKGVGLSTPESVVHDETADVYLVSNIEGKPADADGKAFISKLSPDGTVVTLKWIESGKNKVTLNAPKGMALAGDQLYVADLDTVRVFDRKTGAPLGDVKIPGSTFLNDVTATSDGRVLVTDTGLKSGAKGLEGNGTDAVYAIEPAKPGAKERKVTPIAKSKDLGGPNGIVVHGGKTWVAAFGSGELYSLDAKGKKGDVQKLPKGALDGVFFIGDDVIVSSWDANAIYRGKPGSDLKVVIEDVKSPANIGYDEKRGRVLVPLFTENEVRAYDLK